jgi:GH15 family glucan-1,4-alpha-glucosidase
MHLNEQIDKDTGIQKSAFDLTWSYASLLKALHRRNNLALKLNTKHENIQFLNK